MAGEIKQTAKLNITVFVAVVIIAVIAISGLSGFFGGFKITGFYPASPIGTASINLTSLVDITLTDANMTFGNGSVMAGNSTASIESTGRAAVNGTWVATNDPLILENTGNIMANVSVYSSTAWLTVIGGTGAQAYVNYTSNESTSCLSNGGNGNAGTWIPGPQLTGNMTNLCAKLNFSDASDTLRIDLQLRIPSDTPPGDKSNQLTFSATQSTN